MKIFNQLVTEIVEALKDKNFLNFIHWTENIVAKVLSLALIIVIFISLFDLTIVIFGDLLFNEPLFFFERSLMEIFGLFLNILIALELLENITAYLRKHIFQVELVVVTALIAVARKIIIFDPKQYDKVQLISLALASLALSASYWLIRQTNKKNNH